MADTPQSIEVTPDKLTLRTGESAPVEVGILPATAPQTFTATIQDPKIAEITQTTVPQWKQVGDLKGPQGPKGDKGDKGEQGEAGTRGSLITVAAGAPPADETGLIGDLYIDSSTGDLYQMQE